MLLSYKYRLNPSSGQIVVLEEQLRFCRWVYNTLLGYCFDERRAGRGTPTQFSLQYLLPTMKAQTPELDQVHSQVLQNVAKRVRSGFENYWTKKKLGMRTHLPRFRRADKYNSLTYPQSGFILKDELLKLSKMGALNIILHRPVEGEVKTLTVKREQSGKWYAIFACEVEAKPIEGRLPAVGVDFGLKSTVALSDGTTIEAPQFYRKSEERLGRLQRIHSKRKLRSRNREKARIGVAKLSEKITNQRRDFLNKIARGIVNKYKTVYIEDLKVANMVRNRHLSKSIGDAGWGRLRHILTYMAERSEGVMVCVDPRNTSQLCSGCGELVTKDLAERVHRCSHCGLVMDRDVNAARNILRKGIGLGQPESTPVGEETTTMLSEAWQVASMNQEVHHLSGG